MAKADIPALKEPSGLLRTDGKRPDGVTLLPWKQGKCATWDVTVSDTLAQSCVHETSQTPGAAAEAAAERKRNKYSSLSQSYLFFPIAAETMGAISKDGRDFLCELGKRITQSTDDHRQSAFLFQRLSVLSQRYNAVAVLVPSPTQPPRMKCSRSSICSSFSLVYSPRDLYYRKGKNNNTQDDIYSAILYGRSHMREFTPSPLSESQSAPGGRQLVSQAANLTFESACRLPYAEY